MPNGRNYLCGSLRSLAIWKWNSVQKNQFINPGDFYATLVDLNNDMSNITGNIGVGFGKSIIAEGGFKTDGKYIELSYGGGVGAAAEVTLIPIDANIEIEGKYEIALPFNLGQRGGLIPKYNGSPSYSEWMNMFRGNGW
ncbi:hypothetical protein AAFJ72_04970 [Brevibacillus gelatini]|uniref:hypothetical protein n=1 Tax=Brevibacillus gelatini TaxID=1655277 RepID=UPI003D816985